MNLNLLRLKEVALALGELRHQVVFVGGATVGLYIDDPAAPLPQPSEDIDCVVEVATYTEWCRFEDLLRGRGFQDFDPRIDAVHAPTCRKIYLGMKVDFMPVDETVLGYGNPWFRRGLERSVSAQVEGVEIKIFRLPYFIASKLRAFSDRGRTEDIRFSQDLEDLSELFDGCSSVETEILSTETDVKVFILQELREWLLGNDFREAIYGYLGYDDSRIREARLDRIFLILRRVCGSQ
ncbi:MAG: hypothetical protein ACLGG7_05750 [Bacteriovoracia bacterium]